MVTRKALVIEDAFLRDEDAPAPEDVLVFVGEYTVDLATYSGAVITLEHSDLEAIQRMMAEEKGVNRSALGSLSGTVEGKPWQPDWSKIPEWVKFISKDANGMAWGYASCPTIFWGNTKWFSSGIHERLPELDHQIPGSWDESLRIRQSKDKQGGLEPWQPDWSKLDPEIKFVTRDENSGQAWGWKLQPIRDVYRDGKGGFWHSGGGRVLDFAIPDHVDWTTVHERPQGDELAFLGLSWADVPEPYKYVAMDEDGQVFGYAMRPWVDGRAWWRNTKDNVPPQHLCRVQLPANLDWRNTLFVRPGYTPA